MQTLDAYCTTIVRLINVIFAKQLVLVMIKKHVKLITNGLLRYSTSTLIEIVKRVAHANFVRTNARISRQVKLNIGIRVVLVCINTKQLC